MSKAQEAVARARRTAQEARANAVEMVAEVGTSYLIGSLEASGRMRDIPQFLGLPRTVTLAVVAKLIEYNSSGRVSQAAAGVGASATAIAVYQFAKGGTVSGVAGVGALGRRGAELESASRRALGKGKLSAARELDALEREAAE